MDDLLAHVDDTGWEELLVLSKGDPIRLELWTGDGHWHAQTTYRYRGDRVSVTQAGGSGLPPGRLVDVRGEDGIRSGGNLYWIERAFTIAIAPGESRLAADLEWIPVR